MHIVYLDPSPIPGATPQALQILYTVDGLAQVGIHVTLIVPTPRVKLTIPDMLERPLHPGVEVVHIPDLRKRWFFPSSSNRPFYFRATRELSPLQADAVLVRNLKMAEFLLRSPIRQPLFFETHELFSEVYRDEHPQRNWWQDGKLDALIERERYVYEHSKGLLGLTHLLGDDVQSFLGRSVPYLVVPDGVDLAQASERARDPAPDVRPRLLYLGSLHRWKGIETAIAAMAQVHDALLLVAGGGAERIRQLTDYAHELHVTDRVRFLGQVAPNERFNWIHNADICVLPLSTRRIAQRYTSPLKLFEYMAAGKPIVVSDLPSIREIIEHRTHALMVEVENPRAFANGINELLGNETLRKTLAHNARVHAEQFSWRARAEKIASFIARNL